MNEQVKHDYETIAEFVYNKKDSDGMIVESKWRKVGVTDTSDKIIRGYDFNDNMSFKSFKAENICGGMSKVFSTPKNS